MKKVLFVYTDTFNENTAKRCFNPYSSLVSFKNQEIQSKLIHYLFLNEQEISENDIIIMPSFGQNNSKISKRYELELFSLIDKYPEKRFIYDVDFIKFNDQTIRFIEKCPEIIVSNGSILDKVKGLVEKEKNIHIIKNCIDKRFFDATPKAIFDDKIKISWVSNDMIGLDLINKISLYLKNKYGDAVVLNTFLPNVFHPYINGLRNDIIKTYEVKDIQTIFSVLKSTDILINPFDNNQTAFSCLGLFKKEERMEFVNCKSEEAFVNAGIAGIPLVTSPNPQHSSCIENGQSAYIANDIDEWCNYISELIENEQKRKWLGLQANKVVCENYIFENLAEEYFKIINKD